MSYYDTERVITIGVVAPHLSFQETAGHLANEIEGVRLEIFKAALEETKGIGPELIERKVDVLVSRAGTANLLKEYTKLPVVSCDITFYDLVLACQKAKEYSDKIAVILFGSSQIDITLIEKILGVSIYHAHAYRDTESVVAEIKKMFALGSRVVVGSSLAAHHAKQFGLPVVVVESSEHSLKDALKVAANLARVRRAERELAEEMNVILDFTYSGVIAIDTQGKIKVFNNAARKIMAIKEDPIGKDIQSVVPNTKLDQVMASGKAEIGEIQSVHSASIITSRVPIIVEGELIGAVATFQEASHIQKWEQKLRKEFLGKGLVAKKMFKNIIGSSLRMQETVIKAKQYAKSDLPVLIAGETGTGKEVFAQSIHNESLRAAGPFVAVNCSALPESLLESELFGYEEGSFTGARKGGKQGLFELAHGGTIFLDEIGNIPPALQSRLLRVLQEKEVMRIGADRVIPVDFRLIVATNVNLADEVREGRFRSDLYFRLHVLNLNLPVLRERGEDIFEFLCFFLEQDGLSPQRLLTGGVKERLIHYSWPGNIRELEAFCHRLAILADTMSPLMVLEEYLSEVDRRVGDAQKVTAEVALSIGPWQEMEKEAFRQVLKYFNDNRTLSANVLKISRATLWKKLK